MSTLDKLLQVSKLELDRRRQKFRQTLEPQVQCPFVHHRHHLRPGGGGKRREGAPATRRGTSAPKATGAGGGTCHARGADACG